MVQKAFRTQCGSYAPASIRRMIGSSARSSASARVTRRWLITHEILYGDPALPALWEELDQLLRVQFQRQDGNLMRVVAALYR